MEVLEWPSQSPGLSPIKNLWKELKTAVHNRSPSNLTELELFAKEEWARISVSRCNGTHCEDIDECQTISPCFPSATCNNTIGNYTCTCNDGFSGNGTHCDDDNECETSNSCSPNATCTNTIGNYSCTCKNGFSGNGTHCDDDNECETSNSCSPNATCTNTIGNYSCTCKNGFSGDGTHCADIDECKTTNNCSPYATCTNTIGSYKCTCNDGFSGTIVTPFQLSMFLYWFSSLLDLSGVLSTPAEAKSLLLCYHDFVLLAESSGMQSGISAPAS
ncbi:unnamed protein product [Ranitomeya imitator]|uniref:EGF-like domain-containing protein n=1 Tax=Ranitomeya imitator TaxID=111125 RepID=A0ABN9M3U8_9NEOB|nr:unnamed protein product [Ranitomeya imitator]